MIAKADPHSFAETGNSKWGARSIEHFEKLEQIGEGTYGKVYRARSKETGEIVALKKVRMANEKEGFPITAVREIKLLKELNHPNIVRLKEIVTSRATKEKTSSIYMVFEYMDHDLTGLMINEGRHWNPRPENIKCYMKQLLEGLNYCHQNGVLHRDIKGSNLLISNRGDLKLADFGLARPYSEQNSNYTNRVITLWYRPPELLLGATQYGPSIDMWSAGYATPNLSHCRCILAELICGKAILPGKDEAQQLNLIWELCGTPSKDVWPKAMELPYYNVLKPKRPNTRGFTQNFPRMCGSRPFQREALDLLDRLLTLDPAKRITAGEALDHDYFWTAPFPCKPQELPQFPSSHEYQAKKRKMGSGFVPDPKRQRVPVPPPGKPMGNHPGHPQGPPRNGPPRPHSRPPGPHHGNDRAPMPHGSHHDGRPRMDSRGRPPPNMDRYVPDRSHHRHPPPNRDRRDHPPQNGERRNSNEPVSSSAPERRRSHESQDRRRSHSQERQPGNERPPSSHPNPPHP